MIYPPLPIYPGLGPAYSYCRLYDWVHSELAFKEVESYTQRESPSIRSFLNEVLKLCKEADGEMSEATKLKTLLKNTKPVFILKFKRKKLHQPVKSLDTLKKQKNSHNYLILIPITRLLIIIIQHLGCQFHCK